jgi:hypothetical protein
LDCKPREPQDASTATAAAPFVPSDRLHGDERLGVMATGLSGEYCWAVAMARQEGISVRIEPAALPPSHAE